MDLLIRNVSNEVHAALREKAGANGKTLEGWLREQVTLIAAVPAIRKRYSFKAFGANGAYVTIDRRYADGDIQHGAKNCNQEQFDAFNKAVLHCQRNELGDYEAAHKLLSDNFDEVFPG